MTPEQFAYWLQGFCEMTDETPSEEQWQMIKDHLSEVFHKVTPNRKPEPAAFDFEKFKKELEDAKKGEPEEHGPLRWPHYITPTFHPNPGITSPGYVPSEFIC